METIEAYLDMKDIKPEFAESQIRVREDLLDQCVGSLYPAILLNEIEKLKILKTDFIIEEEMKL